MLQFRNCCIELCSIESEKNTCKCISGFPSYRRKEEKHTHIDSERKNFSNLFETAVGSS